ncbi:hypothetical protein BGZ94_003765 [Podila epigama]|nr:hypothetical protein BGZ94_003765 [Podila epigama]
MDRCSTPALQKCTLAFGVADRSSGETQALSGKTDGHASSTTAELMGLLAAIASAPPGQDILIQLDNQEVVDQFQTLVVRQSFISARHQQRALYAGLWAVIVTSLGVSFSKSGREEEGQSDQAEDIILGPF